MKLKHSYIFQALLGTLLLFSAGCATMYIPGNPSIPLMTEKGETQIQAGTSTNSIVASGAYAYSDKYAIMGGISVSQGHVISAYDFGDILVSGKGTNIFNGGSFKHWNSELAVGRYRSPAGGSVFETYAGVVYGNAETQYSRFQNTYGSLFLQGNFGIKKKVVELGSSLRVAGSWFDYTYPDAADVMRNEQFPVLSARLGGVIRVGNEKVKFWISPAFNYSYAFTPKSADELRLGYVEGKKYHVFEGLQNNFYTIFHLAAGVHFTF